MTSFHPSHVPKREILVLGRAELQIAGGGGGGGGGAGLGWEEEVKND